MLFDFSKFLRRLEPNKNLNFLEIRRDSFLATISDKVNLFCQKESVNRISDKKIKVTLVLFILFFSTLQTKVIAQETLDVSDCNQEQIDRSMTELKEGKIEAFDFLVKCNTQAIPTLISALKDPDETVRIASIAILGEGGEDAAVSVPYLIDLLDEYGDSG